MSANYKVIAVIVALSLLICLVESKALTRPRIIRAEYRNKELSMARGYGKRDVNTYLDNDYDEKPPRSVEFVADSSLNEPKGQNDWERLAPLSIDLVVEELRSNPKELKAFLSRSFDANRDGKLSVEEFLGNANVAC